MKITVKTIHCKTIHVFFQLIFHYPVQVLFSSPVILSNKLSQFTFQNHFSLHTSPAILKGHWDCKIMTIAKIFMLHARKVSFNQSILILMSLTSSAVCCPCFETKGTEINTLSGKENTAASFCLFLCVTQSKTNMD